MSRASQLAALVVGSQPGERVLDGCAAPGGKSLILQGEVTAVELHPGRAEALAKRMPPNVRVVTADLRELDESGFDRALVDAPCSGLGVLARRPDLRWRASPLPELQLELLRAAAERTKPGGTVVYSVCTLNADENEAVVDAAGLEIEPLGDEWPQYAHPTRPGVPADAPRPRSHERLLHRPPRASRIAARALAGVDPHRRGRAVALRRRTSRISASRSTSCCAPACASSTSTSVTATSSSRSRWARSCSSRSRR